MPFGDFPKRALFLLIYPYRPMIPVKSLANPHSERKRLGAFYTPENLSRILTDWAIRNNTDKVLEPSFGRCGFLVAARRRLESLGCSVPRKQIFGCDIDPGALGFLVEALGYPVDTQRFLQDDFLDLAPGVHWPCLFEVAIGNPPYIPFQAISEKRRNEFAERMAANGIPAGKRASLWAHFLVHAVSFVAPGGRMAWVLPGAFLQADYATAVRQYLKEKFTNILCVLMHQRFFKEEGTEEETVVLLAKERCDHESACEILFSEASSVESLACTVDKWEAGQYKGRVLDARPSYLAMKSEVLRVYENVRSGSDCYRLGDFLKVNIGLVTGANSFFVLKEKDRQKLLLEQSDTVPILAKFKAVPGISFKITDHISYVETGGSGYLIHAKELPNVGSPLRQYLETFSEEERRSIRTFKKRSVWHSPDDGKIPDAFLPVMNHDGPRLALNIARINCTNTIHRVFFAENIDDIQRKLVAISLLTSFSQLSSEFVGRRYGSGVLKHEPREAEKIFIIFPDNIDARTVEMAFSQIDDLIRVGNLQEAHKKADQLIFKNNPDSEIYSELFSSALSDARNVRRHTRHLSGV